MFVRLAYFAMERRLALQSGVAGSVLGSLLASGLWWAGGFSIVLIAAVSAVWAAAIASALYVLRSHQGDREAGPWGAVVGGSLLFGVVLNVSGLDLSNEAVTALTLLAIGFTLMGYVGGMAAAYYQTGSRGATDETVANR